MNLDLMTAALCIDNPQPSLPVPQENKSIVLALAFINRLPPDLPYIPELSGEKQLWANSRQRYQILSVWLNHLMLGAALPPKLLEEPYIYEKPFAEISAATFRLCVGVHPRANSFDIKRFESPYSLWFACQWGNSLKYCKDVGLLADPRMISKKGAYTYALEVCNKLQAYSLVIDPMPAIEEYATAHLLMEAQTIAKNDSYFRRDYYRPFLKLVRSQTRDLTRCKKIQMGWMQADGSIQVTGNGKRVDQM